MNVQSETAILATFSQFSRTYGYKIFYIETCKTECINNCFTKFETYEQALEQGLLESFKLIK